MKKQILWVIVVLSVLLLGFCSGCKSGGYVRDTLPSVPPSVSGTPGVDSAPQKHYPSALDGFDWSRSDAALEEGHRFLETRQREFDTERRERQLQNQLSQMQRRQEELEDQLNRTIGEIDKERWRNR